MKLNIYKHSKKILVIFLMIIIIIFVVIILEKTLNNNNNLTYSLDVDVPSEVMERINLKEPGEELIKYDGKYYLFIKRGQYSSGGYSIDIQNVEIMKSKVNIYVETSSPELGDVVTLAFTYPYDVVVFNKKPKGINILYE